jgi:hypothetical protein
MTIRGVAGAARGVGDQQMIDQALHVDTLDEEARRPRLLDRLGDPAARLH